MTAFVVATTASLLVVFLGFALDLRLYRTQQALARNYAEDVLLAQELRHGLESQLALRRAYVASGDRVLYDELLELGPEIQRTLDALGRWHASAEEAALYEDLKRKEARRREFWSGLPADLTSRDLARLETQLGPLREDLFQAVDRYLEAKKVDFGRASALAETTGYLGVVLSAVLAVGLVVVVASSGFFVRRGLRRIQVERDALKAAKDDLDVLVSARTRRLESAVASLKDFGYSVAHDLRRPARSVVAFSELLLARESGLDEEMRSHLRRVIEAGRRLRAMLDGLLSISELANKRPERERVDLAALARELLGDLRSGDEGRRVEASIPASIEVVGGRGELHVLMQHLLDNAWKFTRDVENARIEVGSETRAGERVYFVRDNGIGFDPAYAGQLFRPFHRLPGAEGFPGLGIGLASASRVVEAHGGRIWAEGAPGRGAAVFFTLGERP